MKIFYTTSILNITSYDETKAAQVIQCANNVVPGHIKKIENIKLITNIIGQNSEDSNSIETLSNIRSSDAFISEMTMCSPTLGFELAYANLHFVPCLYLYHSLIKQAKPSYLIYNYPSRKFWVREYTESNLQQILTDFISMVDREMESARTSFMSTKEIDHYIAAESDKKGISKGEVIRQALTEMAKKYPS